MERAPHRPGLDQTTLSQGAIDLAVPRRLAPDADRKLSRGRDLCLDTAQTTDDVGDSETTDRIEEVALHPPCERLLPADPHRHPVSVLANPAAGLPDECPAF
jgi:hypothetical protein